MKKFEDLTKEELNKLNTIGLLQSIYPEAEKCKQPIKRKAPRELEIKNFQPLIDVCNYYLKCKEDGTRYKDGENYIFETAIECVFPEKQVWNFINSIDD